MKSKIHLFKAFLLKHIWADFLFTFIIFFLVDYAFRFGKSEKSITDTIFYAGFISLFMTPIYRYFRKEENGFDPYEKVDNVRHYQIGQRPKLKLYLESKGFEVDYNNGSISYFKTDQGSVLSSQQTFLHETEHWIALVASADILEQVPTSIKSIYP